MSNQYKFEFHVATVYGQDGDQDAWDLFKQFCNTVRDSTSQLNAGLLFKGTGAIYGDQWMGYPRNAKEKAEIDCDAAKKLKAEIQKQIVECENAAAALKRQLEVLDANYIRPVSPIG